MQTFLPYTDFDLTATVLDNQRLGKQRVEAYQILNCLVGKDQRSWLAIDPTLRGTIPWGHHPAVLMWYGHAVALTHYTLAMCAEWRRRGFKDNVEEKIKTNFPGQYQVPSQSFVLPWWVGNEPFHNSHKSNLLRKKPDWYSNYLWSVPDNLPYVWPVSLEEVKRLAWAKN